MTELTGKVSVEIEKLREIEHVEAEPGLYRCPWCCHAQPGHMEDCWLAAKLKTEGGVIMPESQMVSVSQEKLEEIHAMLSDFAVATERADVLIVLTWLTMLLEEIE